MPRHRRSTDPPGWLIARDALLRAARARAGSGASLEIGRVGKPGEGLIREVYRANLAASPDPVELSGEYPILVPRRDAEDDVHPRARREAALPERLAGLLREPSR